jgi:hypothetical protein
MMLHWKIAIGKGMWLNMLENINKSILPTFFSTGLLKNLTRLNVNFAPSFSSWCFHLQAWWLYSAPLQHRDTQECCEYFLCIGHFKRRYLKHDLHGYFLFLERKHFNIKSPGENGTVYFRTIQIENRFLKNLKYQVQFNIQDLSNTQWARINLINPFCLLLYKYSRVKKNKE